MKNLLLAFLRQILLSDTEKPLEDVLDRRKQVSTLYETILLTRKETTALLGITVPTLGVWKRMDQYLRLQRTGNRVYFNKADIMKFINSQNRDYI